MKRRSRKPVLVVLAIVLVIATVTHFWAGWSLARYKRHLEASGEKLTVQTLVPPLPDSAHKDARALLAAIHLLEVPGTSTNEFFVKVLEECSVPIANNCLAGHCFILSCQFGQNRVDIET